VSELERVVPLIHYAPFGYTEVTGNKARYKKVQLLTYLAKGKEEFYGWNHICRIANTLRENDIVVIGTDGEGLQTPANVHFLGWVSEAEVLSIMKESAIFLRLAQHDGKSLAVSKALSVGCEVIWTFRHPCCHHVEDNEADVVRKTVEVVETVNTGSMTPNPDNIDFAETHLLRSQVINHYVKRLKQVLHD
jgi:glycosyltransferase involved in cell wall biosynthesis